jgi:purine-binding chemotaxis protein CheW
MSNTVNKYLSFRVGSEWYGIIVDDIIEVLHFMMLTEIPTTSADILGIVVLRDMMMPVVDLRLRFKLPEARLRIDTPIIAVQTSQGMLGIVVDEVDEVEQVTETVYQSQVHSPYIAGIAKLAHRLLLLLDTELLRKQIAVPDDLTLGPDQR